MSTATHPAVIISAPRAPLQILAFETLAPKEDEVLIENWWTASTPLDLHQADAGLAVPGFPARLGSCLVGPVKAAGNTTPFRTGDLVFGYTWRNGAEKAHQTQVLTNANLLARVPTGWERRLQELVTVPNNFVSAWHSLVSYLSIKLPWPKPERYQPEQKTILVWGGASSCGQYALQILQYYGHTNIIATASRRNFDLVKKCGAAHVIDYNSSCWRSDVLEATNGGQIELFFDCIGSQDKSIGPIASLAKPQSTVAILLPVIVRDSAVEAPPIYEMDVLKAAKWPHGVDVHGVRTHFYLDNDFHAKNLQPEIMPTLVKEGIIKPNRFKIVEGKDLLERAQKALDMLRRKEVTGERLVWRIAEGE